MEILNWHGDQDKLAPTPDAIPLRAQPKLGLSAAEHT